MNHLANKNIFSSRIIERTILNPGSTKKTYHIALDISGSTLTYQPGDSVAVIPTNDPKDVDELLHLLKCNTPSIRTFLLERANLQKIHPQLALAINAEFFDPEMTPLDLLKQNPQVHILESELSHLFFPLLPRFYSIASSQLLFPDQIHLVVKILHYEINGKMKTGTASGFLCERAEIGKTPIPIYIQPSRSFNLPQDSHKPIILVGSGCGIAPFRAFMQQRLAEHAEGRNWLFFGERNRKTDFYYEDFWEKLHKNHELRLNLAFSRDGAEKTYVQHKMWEERHDLWKWLNDGANFYVCGDKQMGKDIESTLRRIATSEGGFSEEDALKWFKTLRADKRYLSDVY